MLIRGIAVMLNFIVGSPFALERPLTLRAQSETDYLSPMTLPQVKPGRYAANPASFDTFFTMIVDLEGETFVNTDSEQSKYGITANFIDTVIKLKV